MQDESKPKPLNAYNDGEIKFGLLTNIWRQMEELLFYISRADGNLTVRDLKQMNLIELYTHKTLLKKALKPAKNE